METCVTLDKMVCDSNFLPLEVSTVPAHGRICSEKKPSWEAVLPKHSEMTIAGPWDPPRPRLQKEVLNQSMVWVKPVDGGKEDPGTHSTLASEPDKCRAGKKGNIPSWKCQGPLSLLSPLASPNCHGKGLSLVMHIYAAFRVDVFSWWPL